MPPRIHLCLRCLRASKPAIASSRTTTTPDIRHASVQAITPAPSPEAMVTSVPPILRHPPSQPPSHRRPEDRRSQLHRQYTSLLRSTPMMLLFQHNNLKATEWMSLRRELFAALQKVDATRAAVEPDAPLLADAARIQVIKSGVFGAALRVVEYYHPDESQSLVHPADPSTQSSLAHANATPDPSDPIFKHGLSRQAYEATIDKKLEHALTPLLSGPLAVLTFPGVSTEHLKAALSILSPKGPAFPAPKRKANPGYWEPSVQAGVQKLMLLGARVEGKVFDLDGTRWVGGIGGGMGGLRAQLVAMLQGVGGGITNTLEGAGRSLYFTMEGRKQMLEEEEGGEGKSE